MVDLTKETGIALGLGVIALLVGLVILRVVVGIVVGTLIFALKWGTIFAVLLAAAYLGYRAMSGLGIR